MSKLIDIPEGTDIIDVKKKMNRMLSVARNESKPTTCILCGKPKTSFCNSHSVPQLALKNIADKGMLLLASSLIGIEVVDYEKGVNNSGTFHYICNDCGSSFFEIMRMKKIYRKDQQIKCWQKLLLKIFCFN